MNPATESDTGYEMLLEGGECGLPVGSSPEEAAVSVSRQGCCKLEWVREPGKGHVGAALWRVPHM